MEQRIEAKLALGGHAEVVGELEALIGEHPYRERLHAQLMIALYRSERQADALQVYQDARGKLVDELGIEPGERLRDLERAILVQDPDLQLAAVEGSKEAQSAGGSPRAARLSAVTPNSRSSPPVSMTLSPAGGACSCFPESPASARADSPTS